MPVDLEREPLLNARGIHHHGSAREIELGDSLPDQLPDARRNVSDENPGADFQHPATEVAPQASRYRRKDDNGQKGISS